jgi:membrane protein implicated in regulation of membrane protease activity
MMIGASSLVAIVIAYSLVDSYPRMTPPAWWASVVAFLGVVVLAASQLYREFRRSQNAESPDTRGRDKDGVDKRSPY